MGAVNRGLPIHLAGLGAAGLWCLLARALASGVARTVVDAAHVARDDNLFARDDNPAWLDDLYLPHIRRAGDTCTAAALIAPGPLYVHHAGPGFPSDFCSRAYRAAAAPDAVHVQVEEADAETIVNWLAGKFQVG